MDIYEERQHDEDNAASYTESSAGCTDTEEDTGPQNSQKRFIGRVKSCGNEYGFIECAETFQQFGRDVHFTRKDVPEELCQQSQCLSFVLAINERGRPQAKDVKGFGVGVQKQGEPITEQLVVEQPNRETSPASSTTNSARGLTLTRVVQPKAEPWANIEVESTAMLNSQGAALHTASTMAMSSTAPAVVTEAASDTGGLELTALRSHSTFAPNGLPESDDDEDEVLELAGASCDVDTGNSDCYSDEDVCFRSGIEPQVTPGSTLSAQAAPFVPSSSTATITSNADASEFTAKASQFGIGSIGDRAPLLSANAPEFRPGGVAMVSHDDRPQLSAAAPEFQPARAPQLSAGAAEFHPASGAVATMPIDGYTPQLSVDAPEFQPGNYWTEGASTLEEASEEYGDKQALAPPGYEGVADRKMTQLFANLATKMAETRNLGNAMSGADKPTSDGWEGYHMIDGNSTTAWESYNVTAPDNAWEGYHLADGNDGIAWESDNATTRDNAWEVYRSAKGSKGRYREEADKADKSNTWKSSWWKSRESYHNGTKWSHGSDEEDGAHKWWADKDYDRQKHRKWDYESDEDNRGKWWTDKNYQQGTGRDEQASGSKLSKNARKKAKRRLKAERLAQERMHASKAQPYDDYDDRPPLRRPRETEVSSDDDSSQTSDEVEDGASFGERPPVRERPPVHERPPMRERRPRRDRPPPRERDSDESEDEDVFYQPRQQPPAREQDSSDVEDEDSPREPPPYQPRQRPPLHERDSRQHSVFKPARAQPEELMEDHARVPDHQEVEPSPTDVRGVKTRRWKQESKEKSDADAGSAGIAEKPERGESEAAQPAPAPAPRPKEATVDVARFQRMALGHLTRPKRPTKREVHKDSGGDAADAEVDN